MNPKNFVPSRAGYELISRIDEPDKFTVVVHLIRPYAPFIRMFMTVSSTSYCVLPKHLLGQLTDINHADFNNHPIGTGPFRVVSYEKDVEVKFVANPLYFRGPPNLKKVDYHIVPNDNTLLTQIRTHEIDLYYRASEAQAPMLGSIAGTTVYETPFTRFGDIGFNAANPPLDDVRVRRALAYRRFFGRTTITSPGMTTTRGAPRHSWTEPVGSSDRTASVVKAASRCRYS
jgi:peptide/nickel transport system substrate-binding protein